MILQSDGSSDEVGSKWRSNGLSRSKLLYISSLASGPTLKKTGPCISTWNVSNAFCCSLYLVFQSRSEGIFLLGLFTGTQTWGCIILFPSWHDTNSYILKSKIVRNFNSLFVVFSLPSCFLLSRSFLPRVYVHAEMHVFLFNLHASTECLLGLVVGGNSLQDLVVVCVILSVGAHNSLGLGQNIAAGLRDIPLNSTGYLSSPANVRYIPVKFFHFLSECCIY